jgi:Tripartite tricarboxylate transporter family receptor
VIGFLNSGTREGLAPHLPVFLQALELLGYEGILWTGIVEPAGTPKPVIEKLASAFQRVVRTLELAELLKRDGVEPVGSTPEGFGALIAREIARWRDLGQSAKIRLTNHLEDFSLRIAAVLPTSLNAMLLFDTFTNINSMVNGHSTALAFIHNPRRPLCSLSRAR